jgi:hypothetical protein
VIRKYQEKNAILFVFYIKVRIYSSYSKQLSTHLKLQIFCQMIPENDISGFALVDQGVCSLHVHEALAAHFQGQIIVF